MRIDSVDDLDKLKKPAVKKKSEWHEPVLIELDVSETFGWKVSSSILKVSQVIKVRRRVC